MAVQYIEIGGEKMVVLPEADYERLLAEAEERGDAEAAAAAERRRGAGEEYLPADMVDRLIAGEHPLRVWRRHRGKTLKAVAEEVGMSIPHLSDIERRRRTGARYWRQLATALGVDVDDIVPQTPG